MSLQDCIKFANDNPVCYVATADGDQPRVRAFRMWFADEHGFYFSTQASKAVCNQLKSNPKVEVCFYAPGNPPGIGKMMRVAGEVEFLDDMALKTRLLEERPFLKKIGTGKPEDPLFVVFRIHGGEAHFWTLANNVRESEMGKIQF